MSEEQARLCKSFALEKKKLELTYRKQVESLAWETEMLWALLKDGPAVAGGEQDSTGGPIPLSPGRREQPCHVDAKQSPTPALASRVPLKSLGHSLGEISQEGGFSSHRKVVIGASMWSGWGSSLGEPTVFCWWPSSCSWKLKEMPRALTPEGGLGGD